MSSNAFLNAIGAMELSQNCVQATQTTDSPLKQIPGFGTEVIKRCQAAGVESVYDVMELEDDDRSKLLQMDDRAMSAVANFCNSYPSIDLTYVVDDLDSLSAGSPITINLTLEREDDDLDQVVIAPFYPLKKQENYWAVVGEKSTNQLLAIKKVTIQKRLELKLDFTLPKGAHDLKLYLISDAYVGADQYVYISLRSAHASLLTFVDWNREHDFKVTVGESIDSDEDDSDEDENAMDED